MKESLGTYDQLGVFTLADDDLIQCIGGSIDIFVRQPHHFGLPYESQNAGCVTESVPTGPTGINMSFNLLCVNTDPRTRAYNVACTEASGGLNPVCFTNAACP